ncbi:MAG: magnesium transporter [Planctomycetaceae bacterium]|nr:magnesium transporter [Planctomycetaceae bacterium]MCA9045781.1 magnesium transporter [Planctomycetaceae bacterium]MCB9954128.1 magnesium transporter [Planctomycetaceae bacterium]
MSQSPFTNLVRPDIEMMLAEGDVDGMREVCEALYSGVVAEILEDMSPERAWDVFRHASPATQAELLSFFPLSFQMRLVEIIDRASLSKIIEEMPADDRVDLLGEMDADHFEAIMPLIAQAERAEIRKLLSYPEESAGSIMTTEYASLPAGIKVREALDKLRVQAPSRETIYYIYITDEERHLMGFLSLRKLIQAKPDTELAKLMDRDVIYVRVTDDQEDVANEIRRYDFIAIPVVDEQNRLVGIVTHDDAADVLADEATEDAHLAAGVQPLDESYIDTPFFVLAQKRALWLVVLLGAASATAQVLGWLESDGSHAWMVLFLPMVLASGGNAGSQSATLVIRALATEEVEGMVGWIAWREARIGACLGFILATLAGCVSFLMRGPWEAVVVASTVFSVVMFGTVVGAMLPLALKRFNQDPAIMSNPMIAALSDLMGVLIYYTAAAWLLTKVL